MLLHLPRISSPARHWTLPNLSRHTQHRWMHFTFDHFFQLNSSIEIESFSPFDCEGQRKKLTSCDWKNRIVWNFLRLRNRKMKSKL
jgi:hypothetical protein